MGNRRRPTPQPTTTTYGAFARHEVISIATAITTAAVAVVWALFGLPHLFDTTAPDPFSPLIIVSDVCAHDQHASTANAANSGIKECSWLKQISNMGDWLGSTRGSKFVLAQQQQQQQLGRTYHDEEEFLTSTVAGLASQRLRTLNLGTVSTVVAKQPGKGRGVFFAGEQSLPPNSLVALYPCLLVRLDLLQEWVATGRADIDTAVFWDQYSIESQFSHYYKFLKANNYDDNDNNDSDEFPWYCAPVGEAPEAPWFQVGPLDELAIGRAIAALNAKRLSSWNNSTSRLYLPEHHQTQQQLDANKNSLLQWPLNAHILNEPTGNEHATVQHIADMGMPCDAFDHGRRVCGSVLEARTIKTLHPGEQLTWCYGRGYDRAYDLSTDCH